MPTEGPHLHDLSTNTAEHSASFQISPLEKRYHEGQLLGYIVRYAPLGGPNNSEILLEVDEDTRRVNLVNLTEGPTYILAIAGFTSKGEGKPRIYAITCKLLLLRTWTRCYEYNTKVHSKLCSSSLNLDLTFNT